jgi:hypothetical protein
VPTTVYEETNYTKQLNFFAIPNKLIRLIKATMNDLTMLR